MDEINCWRTQFKSKPEHLVIHVRTNDLTNGINLLNNGKKIVKKINENLPKTCITFSSIINRKDRKDIDKNLTDTNQRFKSYCRQKNINYIENANIDENCLGVKKLHLSRKGTSCFGKNLLKYLSNVWLDSDTVNHESVQKLNYYTESRTVYSKDIRATAGQYSWNSNSPYTVNKC